MKTLEPRLALVVAQTVPRIFVHVLSVHFPVFTHDLTGDAVDVFTDRLGANGQPRVVPEFCTECGVFFGIQLPEQWGGLVSGVTPCFGQPAVQIFSLHLEQHGQCIGVDVGEFAWNDHQVVARNVAHPQFTVPVQTKAPGGLKHLLLLCQSFSPVFVFVGGDLHLKQADHKHQSHGEDRCPHNALSAAELRSVQLHG